jgi:TIR domain-containing protein
MAHDVFISHSAQNRDVADAICAALEKAVIRCWVAPRDVRPGRSFPGEITRAIQQSKVMLLIFSGHSNNSEQVLREVQLATDARLAIIRFRIEDVALTDDLKYFLSTPHWLDALTPPLSKHIARLELAIKELLGQSVEVIGKDLVSSDVPRAVAPDATPPVPSAVAPAMPPPLPMAAPVRKERETVAPKSFNPWPLLAIAAVVIFAAIIGVIFILLRQPAPSKQQTSTTPSQSARTPGAIPTPPSPPATRVTQNPPPKPARLPKTTPADTQHSSESENVSAFERAGALKRPSQPKSEPRNQPKNAFDRAGSIIGSDQSSAAPSPQE